jgi:mono/diheme cytochrome c family protein
MRTLGLALAAALLASTSAVADSRRTVVTHPAYQEECGGCHIAYPPRFLAAGDWHRLMQGLGRHFGTDAAVSPELTSEIGAFLEANAGRKERNASPRTARITETGWFRHEHDEVAPGKFRSPAVKSAANCGACHTRAGEGSFREREIRVPR